MKNYYQAVQSLVDQKVDDGGLGVLVARASLLARSHNPESYERGIMHHAAADFANKERSWIVDELYSATRVPADMNTSDPDDVLKSELSSLVISRQVRSVQYICDAVDFFVNNTSAPSDGLVLIGGALRTAVLGSEVDEYTLKKRDITTKEYNDVVATIKRAIKKKHGWIFT